MINGQKFWNSDGHRASHLREKLRVANGPALWRRDVKAFVSEVRMTNAIIEIIGMEPAMDAGIGVVARGEDPVRNSMAKWCARQDSNLWPPD